jgi:hypothetical protein
MYVLLVTGKMCHRSIANGAYFLSLLRGERTRYEGKMRLDVSGPGPSETEGSKPPHPATATVLLLPVDTQPQS